MNTAKIFFTFFLLVASTTLFAQSYDISTAAGVDSSGYTGDGSSAISAQFDTPLGIAVDANGNIYIADSWNNCIRKINASTGNISTIAGTGIEGYSGDGNAAALAQLHYPYSVALDDSGNIYIADMGNACIRKISAFTGNINTIAGNGTQGFSGDSSLATSAQLNYPSSIAIDAAGNIFIADRDNYRIRKINSSTGIIYTIAGTGTSGYSGDGGPALSAQINDPTAIALDANNNLYFVDQGNNAVRKINSSNDSISTIAGTGTAGFFGDGGTAASAQFDLPTGIAIGANNNIYISDTQNNAIREIVDSSKKIITIAGPSTAGYSGDGGPATSAQLNAPTGIAVDTQGEIYFSDSGNNLIRKLVLFLGISELNSDAGVIIYPNPASTQVNFGFSEKVKGANTIIILNSLGQIVKEIPSNPGKTAVNTSDLSSGIYFCEIKNGNIITARKKLVIQK